MADRGPTLTHEEIEHYFKLLGQGCRRGTAMREVFGRCRQTAYMRAARDPEWDDREQRVMAKAENDAVIAFAEVKPQDVMREMFRLKNLWGFETKLEAAKRRDLNESRKQRAIAAEAEKRQAADIERAIALWKEAEKRSALDEPAIPPPPAAAEGDEGT